MRFSIRDILLLTVIVALATGWALDRWRLAKQRADQDHRVHRLVEAQLARAAELENRLVQQIQAYQQANAEFKEVVDNVKYAAENEELVKHGYLDTLRGLRLGRPTSRTPLELTTEPAESDH